MPMELSAWLTPAIVIAVAALLLRSNTRLEERLGARIDETNKRIDETNKRLDDTNRRLDGIDSRLRAVEHGQARLEGLLEGLREAISGRRPAA